MISVFKMEIFLILSIIIFAMIFFGTKVFNSAKRNLFKDQSAWSGKDLKIKYSKSRDFTDLKGNDNYLRMIAAESKIYLDDQSNKEEE